MSTLHYFDAGKNQESFKGNSKKSEIIESLVNIPKEQRNEEWIASFLQNIDECVLKMDNPEVAVANDGFPYMNLRTLDATSDKGSFVLTTGINQLMNYGFGMVINKGQGYPDWLFSFGDLLNYQLNGEFYTEDSLFSEHGTDFNIPAEEKILIGQPSAEILPDIARLHIREYLESVNITTGKLLLMARNYQSDDEVTQDLVFNITPEDFSSPTEYEQVMQTIAWFLPRHYSLVGIKENAVNNGFESI